MDNVFICTLKFVNQQIANVNIKLEFCRRWSVAAANCPVSINVYRSDVTLVECKIIIKWYQCTFVSNFSIVDVMLFKS